MDALTKLAVKYGADKWGKHNYTPFYYELFNERRISVMKILEIGVGEWAGLKMFHEYFYNSYIYGADNEPKRLGYNEIAEVFYCDQSKKESLEQLLLKTGFDLDLVIDDGSHKPEDQLLTCLTIVPKLKAGSIYIIEDVADKKLLEQLLDERIEGCTYEMKKLSKRYDDRLIIIKKWQKYQ